MFGFVCYCSLAYFNTFSSQVCIRLKACSGKGVQLVLSLPALCLLSLPSTLLTLCSFRVPWGWQEHRGKVRDRAILLDWDHHELAVFVLIVLVHILSLLSLVGCFYGVC